MSENEMIDNKSNMAINAISAGQAYTLSEVLNNNSLIESNVKELVKKFLLPKPKVNTDNAIVDNSNQFNDNVHGNGFNSTERNSSLYYDIIFPQYDQAILDTFYHFSDSLAACIDAYSTNICGFGYEFLEEKPTVEKDGKRFDKKTGKALKSSIIDEMDRQLAKISMFFKSVSLDIPWSLMQKLKTKAKERTGNAYYEVERNYDNEIQGFKLVESGQMFLTVREKEYIEIMQKVKNPITLEFEEIPRARRFRKFVQLQYLNNSAANNASRIYFKEFGDPRIMNAYTGQYLKDSEGNYFLEGNKFPPGFAETFRQNNGGYFKIATEIRHHKIYNTDDIDGYGVARWISLIPTLLGVKFSDLSDYDILKNKGIPSYLMIVEGGNAETIIKQMNDNVTANKVSGENKSFLIISSTANMTGAHTDPSYVNPKIRIEPLNQLLVKDGLMGKINYVEKINERVAGCFRLPTFFIGKLGNINRSVAEVAKDMANEQIFIPESMDEDDKINMDIMTDLGCTYYRYHSKTSQMENPDIKLQAIKDATTTGSMLPGESRQEYAEILGKNLQDIESDFMTTPLPLSIRNKVDNKPNVNPDNQTNNQPDNSNIIDFPANLDDKKKLIKLEKSNDSEVLNNIFKFAKEKYNLQDFNEYDFFIGSVEGA